MRWQGTFALAVAAGCVTSCASHREARTPAPAGPAAAAPAPTPAPATPAPAPSPAAASADLFAQTVRPVLQRSCAPCHEPGGRMYDRLPFDDPTVVRSRAPSVLRRLKTPEDRDALERWLSGGS